MTDGSLTDVSNAVKTVTIDGTEYKFARLLLEDYAAVEQTVKDGRQHKCLEAMRGVPMTEEARGIAMAKAAAQSIPLGELMYDSQIGRLELFKASLRRANPGKPQTLPCMPMATIGEIIVYICNLSEELLSDPTTTAAK